MIRVAIIDDHTMVRHLLRDVLPKTGEIDVVTDFESGEALLEEIDMLQVDVLMMDIGLSGQDGIEVTQELRDRGVTTPVLFLTMHLNQALYKRALAAGGTGYAVKHDAFDVLVEGIKTVAAGGMFCSPALQDQLPSAESLLLEKLTPRELEIISLVASGWKALEIADHLKISERTVDYHRRNIAEKTGLKRIADITKFAIAVGIRVDE